MTRFLFDTNIVLDVLLNRQPFVIASSAAWASVENRKAEGMLSAHAVTTIHYLLRRAMGNTRAKLTISTLLRVFGVATVNSYVLQEALELPFSDFEDGVTAVAARLAGCAYIVTRDPQGFRGSPVRCLTAEAMIPLLDV